MTKEALATAAVLHQAAERRRRRAAASRRQYLSYTVGMLLSLGLGAAALWLFFHFGLPKPPPSAPTPDAHPAEEASDPFQQWLQHVAALTPDEQVKAVAARLQEDNPDFDGKLTPRINRIAAEVTDLEFSTAQVADLQALQALPKLRSLALKGHPTAKGKLTNLAPLKGLSLTTLSIVRNPVADLAPLKDMPLTSLDCSYTGVADLTPLKRMPLTDVRLTGTKVSDLTPLKGMPLATLYCSLTKVTDLSPLKGAPLVTLYCPYQPAGRRGPPVHQDPDDDQRQVADPVVERSERPAAARQAVRGCSWNCPAGSVRR